MAGTVNEDYFLGEIADVMPDLLQKFDFLPTHFAWSFQAILVFLLAVLRTERAIVSKVDPAESAKAIVPVEYSSLFVDRSANINEFCRTVGVERLSTRTTGL